jgi:hypothetical protein
VTLPKPEPGLVIGYSYLWKREALGGQEEGRKDRPCAIILVVHEPADGRPRVVVAPISHQPPVDPALALELPQNVKQALGLDWARSWVHFEVNRFLWPGPDLRPASRGEPGRFVYGHLPPKLFARIVSRIAELATARRLGTTARTDADEA